MPIFLQSFGGRREGGELALELAERYGVHIISFWMGWKVPVIQVKMMWETNFVVQATKEGQQVLDETIRIYAVVVELEMEQVNWFAALALGADGVKL
eukprot:scaffold6528_cov114-Cylindrotheca_fusiformis.AAC.7